MSLVVNKLYITTEAAGADRALTLPLLSTVNNGDFVSVHIGAAMGNNAHTYAVTCQGDNKIYGNVSVGNALAGVAAVVDGGGLLNNVSNIEAHNLAAVYLGGDTDNNSAGTIGSTITLTAIKGSTNSIWWLSGNVTAADPNTTGAKFIADQDD